MVVLMRLIASNLRGVRRVMIRVSMAEMAMTATVRCPRHAGARLGRPAGPARWLPPSPTKDPTCTQVNCSCLASCIAAEIASAYAW